jgi:hypothetical protein
LLTVITELDDAKLSTAIHHAVSSTLLVSAATPLGVMWRHPLMRDAAICYYPLSSRRWPAAPPITW